MKYKDIKVGKDYRIASNEWHFFPVGIIVKVISKKDLYRGHEIETAECSDGHMTQTVLIKDLEEIK